MSLTIAPSADGLSAAIQINGVNAAQFVPSSSMLSPLIKADYRSPCFIKTGGSTLSIKAGTVVNLGTAIKHFATNTDISMPTLTPGEDYSVWVTPAGTAQCVADPYSNKAVAPVAGAIKIGGFHFSLTAYNTTPAAGSFATTGFTTQGGNYIWTQDAINRIAGINEFSLWDLQWRAKGEQRGMTLDYETKVWHGIYFCGTEHITNGISRYNTNIASGTVLPKIPVAYGGTGATSYARLSQYECEEIAASFGHRLVETDEFRSAMFGVTEAQSLGGSAVTVPATLRQPGYTSRIGVEQATGHIWVFCKGTTGAGASAWVASGNRGDSYGSAYTPMVGGNRDSAAYSGSRCSNWSYVASYSYWFIGLRAACDHLELV
jgi:hypothetical protein